MDELKSDYISKYDDKLKAYRNEKNKNKVKEKILKRGDLEADKEFVLSICEIATEPKEELPAFFMDKRIFPANADRRKKQNE